MNTLLRSGHRKKTPRCLKPTPPPLPMPRRRRAWMRLSRAIRRQRRGWSGQAGTVGAAVELHQQQELFDLQQALAAIRTVEEFNSLTDETFCNYFSGATRLISGSKKPGIRAMRTRAVSSRYGAGPSESYGPKWRPVTTRKPPSRALPWWRRSCETHLLRCHSQAPRPTSIT